MNQKKEELNMSVGLEEIGEESTENYLDENEKNKYLYNTKLGLELCAHLVAKGDTQHSGILREINQYIDDFVKISEEDDNTTGAHVYKKLKEIQDDLNSIISFPQLENKYTVAIGGSFSSGKSRFLNTVLGLNDLLPTNTNPTTSISTYITSGDDEQYYALNNYNNRVPIDEEAIHAISHEFNEKYNVAFSHILKLITIEKANLKYPNLIFLDTPGYSKPDSNIKDKENQIDENIARDHLRNADYLIWLLSCQAPIQGQDLAFLKSLEFDKPILVVLSKADEKLPEDVKQQIIVSEQNLKKQGISVVDVIGFSAKKPEKFPKSNKFIQDFLKKLSKGKSGTKILRKTQRVFDEYLSFYNTHVTELRNTRKIFNDMCMSEELHESFLDDVALLSKQYKQKIDALQKCENDVKDISQNIQTLIEKLLHSTKIDISEVFTECDLHPKGGKNRSKRESFRFNGSIQIEDKKELTQFKNLKALPATIYKVSSIGVFLKINNVNSDLAIPSGEIKKVAGDSFLNEIKPNSPAKVQIVNDKKCVVIIEK